MNIYKWLCALGVFFVIFFTLNAYAVDISGTILNSSDFDIKNCEAGSGHTCTITQTGAEKYKVTISNVPDNKIFSLTLNQKDIKACAIIMDIRTYKDKTYSMRPNKDCGYHLTDYPTPTNPLSEQCPFKIRIL